MIDSWNVLSLLREYYAPQESDEELLPICQAAAAELSARMKDGSDPTDIRLLGAAAASANFRLKARSVFSGDSVSQFRAGDVSVSVSLSDTAEIAEKERDEALTKALPLLKDEGFFFGKVNV